MRRPYVPWTDEDTEDVGECAWTARDIAPARPGLPGEPSVEWTDEDEFLTHRDTGDETC